MKAFGNGLLSKLHLEINWKNYMKKLKKAALTMDALKTQFRHCPKPRVIFDIGANRGWTTKRYLETYPKSVIHAFDPIGNFREALDFHHGKDNKAVFVNQALYNLVSTTDFYINKSADTRSLFRST